MNRLARHALAVVLLGSVLAPLAPATAQTMADPVLDGSFESGNLAAWRAQRTITVAGGDAHGGSFAARLPGRVALRQDVAPRLVAGLPYTFSAWVKVLAEGDRPGAPALRIGKTAALRGRVWGEAVATRATAAGWQKLEITRAFTAKELTRKVFVGVVTHGFTGVALVDDVSAAPDDASDRPASHALGLWSPTRFDTCPKALHDAFFVVGPDGKRHPTWHPPTTTDPATGLPCTFGHEHGRDPRGSDVWALVRDHFAHTGDEAFAGLPFGYVNEQLDAWNAANGVSGGMRHEDHVGHKVEWQNDVRLQRTVNGARVELPITCDFLTKIHQGSHSADAFAMNLHELVYAVACSNGVTLVASQMVAFGAPGEFVRNCERTVHVEVPGHTPAGAPTGSGARLIPDRTCAERFAFVPPGQFSQMSLAFYEDWISGNYLRTPDGRRLAYYDPHFAVFNPARYHHPAAPGGVGRTMDVCYEEPAPGLRARDGGCDRATDFGRVRDVTWDDPRSPFDGAHRETYFNQTTLANTGGPTIWYTDPFGRAAVTSLFPGSLRQHVAATDNTALPTLESQAFGADRAYGGSGVHAPN